MAQQLGHVLGVVAQRRHPHDQHVEMREQVAADRAVAGAAARCPAVPRTAARARNCCGSAPPRRVNWPASSTPTSSRCAAGGQILELVDEQRAAGGFLEQPLGAPGSSRAEQPRLGVGIAQAASDQRHERPRWARGTALVQVARERLAAASRARRSAAPAKDWSRSAAARRAAAASGGSCRPAPASGEPSSLPAWRWRRPASSARSTVRSSFASDSGFSTKSKAPRRVASTAVSTVPWPDIMTTGQPSVAAADHSRSSVMPSTSGIQMSSSTRSGTWRRARGARLRGVGGHVHLVALLGKDLLQQAADVGFVIDDQNVWRCSCSLSP